MTDGIHCQDCRHWDRSKDKELPRKIREKGHRPCRRMRSGDGEPLDEETTAYALDREEYFADTITSPDFACIMAEPIA